MQKLLKLAQPRPHGAACYQGGNCHRDRAPSSGGRDQRDWIKDMECFGCREKGHFAKDCMSIQALQGYNYLNDRGSGVGANPRPSQSMGTNRDTNGNSQLSPIRGNFMLSPN